jgi:cytochrome P450
MNEPTGTGSAVLPVRLPEGHDFWLVSSYDEAKVALADPRLCKRPDAESETGEQWFLPLVTDDPPEHTRLRKLVTKAFAPSRIEMLRPEVERITRGLMAAFPEGETFDLVKALAFPLPFDVTCFLLGVPEKHHEVLRVWAVRLLANAVGTNIPRDRARRVTEYFGRLVAARRAQRARDDRSSAPDDLLADLINAEHGDDRLSDQELASVAVMIFLAGLDTTPNLLGNGIAMLLEHRDQYALLRERPELLRTAVDELLRFEGTAGQSAIRFAKEDLVLGGCAIPAGGMVQIALATANRDTAQFVSPDELDISRTPNSHLAFGYGIHFCLGAALARMQASIVLDELVNRYPGLELACPYEQIPSRTFGTLRKITELPVRVKISAMAGK